MSNEKAVRRLLVQQSMHRVLSKLNIALPGSYAKPVTEEELVPGRVDEGMVVATQVGNEVAYVGNVDGVEAYTLTFRLPRFNGKVIVLASDIRHLAREVPRFSPPLSTLDYQAHQDATAKRDAALDEVIGTILHKAACELRGRAILELVEKEWTIADGDDEQWQKLEHAAMKIFALAEVRRK